MGRHHLLVSPGARGKAGAPVHPGVFPGHPHRKQLAPHEFPGAKNSRTRRFMEQGVLAASRARLRFNKKAAAQLLEQTSELQRQALESHDRLESYYRSAIDFSLVDQARDALIHRLMS